MKALAKMLRITLQTALQVRQFCATAPLGLFALFLSAFLFSKLKKVNLKMDKYHWRPTRVFVILTHVNLWLIVTHLAEVRRILPLFLP